jgi:hypothetical protein
MTPIKYPKSQSVNYKDCATAFKSWLQKQKIAIVSKSLITIGISMKVPKKKQSPLKVFVAILLGMIVGSLTQKGTTLFGMDLFLSLILFTISVENFY